MYLFVVHCLSSSLYHCVRSYALIILLLIVQLFYYCFDKMTLSSLSWSLGALSLNVVFRPQRRISVKMIWWWGLRWRQRAVLTRTSNSLAQLLLAWSVWRCIWPIHFLERERIAITPIPLIESSKLHPSHRLTQMRRLFFFVTSDLKTKVLLLSLVKPLGKTNIVMESRLSISAFRRSNYPFRFEHSGTAVVKNWY